MYIMRNLQEREMDLEDLGTIRRIKLEQCVQLCQFENDANQVNRWIHSAEGKFTTDRLSMYVLLPKKTRILGSSC